MDTHGQRQTAGLKTSLAFAFLGLHQTELQEGSKEGRKGFKGSRNAGSIPLLSAVLHNQMETESHTVNETPLY